MKGRNPSAKEKAYHDLLASNIGCLACLHDHGARNTYGSIHHIDGRTKPDAHWLVLHLCAGHHQDGYGLPGQLAVHGAKARFEAMYGAQLELMALGARQLLDMGYALPPRVIELAGLQEYA